MQMHHDVSNDSSEEIERLHSEIERINEEKEQLEVRLRADDSKLQVSSLSRQVRICTRVLCCLSGFCNEVLTRPINLCPGRRTRRRDPVVEKTFRRSVKGG